MIVSERIAIGLCEQVLGSAYASDTNVAPGNYNFLANDCLDLLAFLPNNNYASAYSTAADATKFSNPSNFRLVVNMDVYLQPAIQQLPPHTICVRLYDLTANAPVSGSEVCRTSDPAVARDGQLGHNYFVAESTPFALPAALHTYTVQAHPSIDPNGNWEAGVIISARLVN